MVTTTGDVVKYWDVPLNASFTFVEEAFGNALWRKIESNEDGGTALNVRTGHKNDCIHFDHLCKIVALICTKEKNVNAGIN